MGKCFNKRYFSKFKLYKIMATFWHHIHNLESQKKQLIDKLGVLSDFFVNGKYNIRRGIIKRTKGNALFEINSSKNVSKKYERAKVFFGEWTNKVIIVFSDFTISFYPECHTNYINNIQKYIDDCNYCNKVKYISINPEQQYVICETVLGRYKLLKKKVLYVINDLLNNMAEAGRYPYTRNDSDIYASIFNECHISDIYCCIQHGDFVVRNILWVKSKYKIIDFDLIDKKPLLNDFFKILFDGLGLKGLKYFFHGYFDKKLSLIFPDYNELSINEEKDKYLALFLIMNLGELKDNYKWIEFYAPDNFCKTMRVVELYKLGLIKQLERDV